MNAGFGGDSVRQRASRASALEVGPAAVPAWEWLLRLVTGFWGCWEASLAEGSGSRSPIQPGCAAVLLLVLGKEGCTSKQLP